MTEPLTIETLTGRETAYFVVRDRGPVRFIIMNRPRARNALNREMRRAFPDLLQQAEAAPGIRAIVLTGAGTSFSAGVDVKEGRIGPSLPPISPNPAEVLRGMRKPVIAAVNGACVTGALEMALSCSFIVASTRAHFADTHLALGKFPRWGQSALLPAAIGAQRARQMLLTSEPIDAARAADWGLAAEIVPPEALLTRCLELGSRIARTDEAAMASLLALMHETDKAALAPGIEAEQHAATCFTHGPKPP